MRSDDIAETDFFSDDDGSKSNPHSPRLFIIDMVPRRSSRL